MNKYEKALLRNKVGFQEDDYTLIEELVERATPKKVLNIHETYSTTLGTCPICGSTIPYGWKYCSEDGQALDWSCNNVD